EGAEERLRELKNGNRPEEIDAAKAAWAEAEAQRVQLLQDWKRNTGLKTGNAVAARDYELAESAFRAQRERVSKLKHDYDLMVKGPRVERIKAAEAEVAQAEAELHTAKWNLDNCTIRAP